MKRIYRRPRPAFVVAVLALFVALGGGAYAATSLPPNSVGTTQLKDNAVISAKVKDHSLLAKDFRSGQLPRGPRGLRGPRGKTGPQGPGAVRFEGTLAPNNTSNRVVLKSVLGENVEGICDSSGDVAVEFDNPSTNTDTLDIVGSSSSYDLTKQVPFLFFQPPGGGNGQADSPYYEAHALLHDRTTGQVSELDVALVGTYAGASACSYWGTVTPSG